MRKLASIFEVGRLSSESYIVHFNEFYVPFKIILVHMRRANSVGGAKMGEPRKKTPGIPASRTLLVSHVTSAGLKSTPDTAVR